MFRTYFATLTTVFTTATGYRHLLQQSLASALLFFCLSLVVLSLSTSLRFQTRQLPQLQQLTEQTLQEISDTFPANFEATWNETNLTFLGTPVDVAYPSFVKPGEWQLPSHLARIENAEPSQEILAQSSSQLFITPTQVYSRNRQTGWNNFPMTTVLEDVPAFTLNQNTLPQFIAVAKIQIANFFQFLLMAVYFLAPIWLILTRLWEVLFNSLFLFFFLRIDGQGWSWRKVFQMGLYLAIPAEVIYQATAWLYPEVNLPMFSISFWVLALVTYLSTKVPTFRVR